MVKTIYLPREREVRFEFVDGSCHTYENVHRREIEQLKAEAVKNWKENRKK